MRTLKISFLVLILSINISAQWYQHYPYPTNDDLLQIQFVSETTGWILGHETIFKTTDGGITWFRQNENICNNYVNFHFSDSLHGWFIVNYLNWPYYYPQIYKTNNGGETWTFLKQFEGSEVEITDKAIYFIDSLQGWLTNFNNILYTTDGGSSWLSPQMNSPVGWIRDVFFYNNMLGWAVTHYGDIINSVDGGHTWNLQISGIDNGLSSVEFTDENHGFIIGSSPPGIPSGSSSVFLNTSDGGITWESHRVDSSQTCYLNSITRLDSENYIAVGMTINTYGSSNSIIYNSTNSGIDWSKTEVERYYNGSSAINDQIVFIVGTTGQIKKSTDRGVTWQWVSKNLILEYPFLSVYFLNDNDGWITAENGSVLSTNNGGESWYYQSSGTNNRLQDIMFANSSLGWIVGYNTILKTTNKGEEWTFVNPGFYIGNCTDVFCIDNNCWITGSGIIRSTDGGANWNQTYLNYSISSTWFVSIENGWAVGGYGAIYKTENSGDTWVYQNSGTTYGLSKVFFINENTGWIYGSEQGTYHILLKTTNGGGLWETIWTHHEYTYIRSLIFLDSLNGWMVGSYDNILRSTDGGYSWNDEVNFCMPNWYASLCFTPSNVGWIAGGDGLILSTKTPITEVEIPVEENVITDFSLSQNYPNPFNPVTKIKFTIPTPPVSSPLVKGRTKEGFVTLKVYDILGREVATLVNEEKPAGEYEVEFDGSSLPSGIYFYQLKTGQFVETRKMILLK